MESRVETLIKALLNGDTTDFTPQSRIEAYLKNCINKSGVEGLPTPSSRLDALMLELVDVVSNSSGGDEAAFERGKKAQHDEFWEDFQQGGARTDYKRAFAYWTNGTFYPKYDIRPSGEAMDLFLRAFKTPVKTTDLVERLNECNVVLDLSKATNLQMAFQDALITHIGTVDVTKVANTTAYGISNLFFNCNVLRTIDKFIVAETCPTFRGTFDSCGVLRNITFEGVIAKNGLNLSHSPDLTHDSLMSVLNCLKDFSTNTSGTAWTVTLGSTNLAKLTTEEQDIANMKGWILK